MATATNPDQWLTARRLRAHGTILALCLWAFYAWNLATPGLRDRNDKLKGTDFLHFYTLGSLARMHDGADLYDMNAQAALAAQRVPQAAGIRYLPLYPPQVSLLFLPLAHLAYGWALILWWSCSAAIYGICCYAVWRACPNLRDYGGLAALLAVAFPAFFHLIAWGQTSALGLACFTGIFFLLRGGREFLAGLVLGCLIFKPQLGLAAVVVFVAIGAWRILFGATLSAAVQLSAGVLYYGTGPLRQWIYLLRHVRTGLPLLEPKLYQTYSLRTFWTMLVPWEGVAFGLYLASTIVTLVLTYACWRRGSLRNSPVHSPAVGSSPAPLALPYSSLLVATVLVAPHLTVYDLVILAPAFLLLADWLIEARTLQGRASRASALGLGSLLYLSYALPLVGPFAAWTHFQLPVVAMAAMAYVIWQNCREYGQPPLSS